MTREEQVAAAFDDYSDARKLCTFDDFEYADIQVAFEEGAEWADANPKFPWISVDNDLPYNHKELIENEHYTKKVLVVLEWEDNPIEKHISICDMCNVIGSYNVDWYWRNIAYHRVILWSPLPELPKE